MTSRILLAAVVALFLAACSGTPPVQTGAPLVTPTSTSEIDAIAALLHQGERRDAEKRVKAALKRDPLNSSLILLKQSITGDALEELGSANYAYVVQPGDTMAKLAQRFLGNRLKAYQLAQYNGIDKPNFLQSGTVLRIPGQPPREPSSPRSARTAPSAPSSAPASSRPRRLAPTQATTTNPAAAGRAHAAGLEALNRGRVSEAVTQLRRAAALNPGNAAISRDLARAERIAATVRSRQ